MMRIRRVIAALLLALSTIGLHADARLAVVTIEARLKDVVIGLHNAIAENRLEQAVRVYHSASPEVTRIRAQIRQTTYLQKTTTLSFTLTGQLQDIAFGKARHRFLRIAGLKFFEKFAEVSYVFRKEGDTWKLWMTRMP